MRKWFLSFAGMVMALFIMLNPANKQDAFALTPVSTLTVSRPNDISDNIHNDRGFLFNIPKGQDEYSYYSFSIPERGWVCLYNDEDSIRYECYQVSSDVSFKSEIYSFETEDNFEGGWIRRYYLDAGKYYLRAVAGSSTYDSYIYDYDMFGYYLPNSKFFSTQLLDKNCNEKTLKLNNKITFTNSALVKGVLKLSDVFRDDMDTLDKTVYNITKNGEYTIFVENYSDEWKKYNFMQSFAVTSIGTHPNSTLKIQKASFTADGKKVKTCNICKRVVSRTVIPRIAKIEFAVDGRTYTGKILKPKAYLYDKNGKKISSSYYSVSYSNNKNIGTANATITLKGYYYSGTKKTTFQIIPKGTSVTSLKAGRNKVVVSWKKASGITGYEIRLSTNKNFPSSDTKVVALNGASRTAASVGGLKSNRTYYIKVRTYKTVNGKKYYSKGSSIKAVKVY